MPAGARADRKRSAIVSAARDVFLRDGYGAGMDAIAAAAGVSKVTVYNHFGSKEALFSAVVGDALDAGLDGTIAAAEEALAGSDDVRAALTGAARAWVAGVNAPEVLELLHVVAAEMRAFPRLTQVWRERGPGRFYPLLESALRGMPGLSIPDIEVAVLQFYALTLYPHLVASLYGDRLRPGLDERLVAHGVDMFLAYYGGR